MVADRRVAAVIALGSLIAALVSWPAARVLTRGLARLASAKGHTRRNLNGEAVPTSTGIAWGLALTAGTVVAWPVLALSSDSRSGLTFLLSLLTAVWGLAAVGLADDILGGPEKGFRGHLSALRHGALTSGGLKMTGGVVVGLAAAAPLLPWSLTASGPAVLEGLATWAAGGLVVGLSANTANCLDAAPGRAAKAASVAVLIMAALTMAGAGAAWARPDVLVAGAAFAGSLAGFLPYDLRREAMLGDAGSNAMGGGLGVLALALFPGLISWAVVLSALGLINYVGEVYSLSRVISRSRFLVWADGLGRAAAGGGVTMAHTGRRICPRREE